MSFQVWLPSAGFLWKVVQNPSSMIFLNIFYPLFIHSLFISTHFPAVFHPCLIHPFCTNFQPYSSIVTCSSSMLQWDRTTWEKKTRFFPEFSAACCFFDDFCQLVNPKHVHTLSGIFHNTVFPHVLVISANLSNQWNPKHVHKMSEISQNCVFPRFWLKSF